MTYTYKFSSSYQTYYDDDTKTLKQIPDTIYRIPDLSELSEKEICSIDNEDKETKLLYLDIQITKSSIGQITYLASYKEHVTNVFDNPIPIIKGYRINKSIGTSLTSLYEELGDIFSNSQNKLNIHE